MSFQVYKLSHCIKFNWFETRDFEYALSDFINYVREKLKLFNDFVNKLSDNTLKEYLRKSLEKYTFLLSPDYEKFVKYVRSNYGEYSDDVLDAIRMVMVIQDYRELKIPSFIERFKEEITEIEFEPIEVRIYRFENGYLIETFNCLETEDDVETIPRNTYVVHVNGNVKLANILDEVFKQDIQYGMKPITIEQYKRLVQEVRKIIQEVNNAYNQALEKLKT